MAETVKKRMGRPKLSAEESRSVQIHLRVTQEERELIQSAAAEMGCSITQVIIHALRELKKH